MKLYNLVFFSLLASYFLLLASSRSPVSAQSLSLSLTPPVVELMIKPGKTTSQTFVLQNSGDDTKVNIQIIPFNENGLILDSLKETVNWLEIVEPSSSFVLKKGEQKNIVLKVSPGADTKEQDYYQALTFKTSPLSERRNSQSNIEQRVSALILMNVTSSGSPKSAEIERFNLPTVIDSFEGVDIDIRVKNTGQSFFHTNGNIFLKGALGEVKYPIIPQIILAGRERQLLLDYKDQRKIKGFFLGKYSLKADFVLDEGNIKISEEQSFFAIPYKLILVILPIIIIIYLIRKKINRQLIMIFIVPTFFFSLSKQVSAQGSEIKIKANLEYKTLVSIYGNTSPNTIVRASGNRYYGHTVSNKSSYFIIENLALPTKTKEVCIEAIDEQNRMSNPLCLPVILSDTKRNIGPVILPPTLSISHNFLSVGTKAFASGRSLPSSKIIVSVFNNESLLPPLEIQSDDKGKFDFTLPTNKPSAFRIFAGGFLNNNPIPKSQTIYYYIYPAGFLLFTKLLPFLLWFLTILATFILLRIYDSKTENIKGLYILIGMKLKPLALRAHLKQKLLWYNLREYLRRSQK